MKVHNAHLASLVPPVINLCEITAGGTSKQRTVDNADLEITGFIDTAGTGTDLAARPTRSSV